MSSKTIQQKHLAWLLAALVAMIWCVPAPFAQQAKKSPQKGEPAGVPVLPKAKKLILTDGSYQLVQSYEIKGDRVRYFSVERAQWEEIPASMVDWDATRKTESEDSKQAEDLVAKLKAEDAAKRVAEVDVDASIEVAPGIFLPPGEGVFLLDGKAVFPLTQAEADIKTNKTRALERVLVPIPIVPGRQTVFVNGQHAKFRITNREPEFFMRTADGREPKIDLVLAQIHKDTRQLEFLDSYFAETVAKRKSMLLQTWEVTKGVYRFTLGQKLEPGEYAIVEVMEQKDIGLYVWDFGIDSSAKK
jgi:hypothetical protein